MMPSGVPGAQQADRVDVYNRLYRERIIFLGQEIYDEISNQIIAVMLYLESEDNTKPIYFYIISPGVCHHRHAHLRHDESHQVRSGEY